MLLLMADILPYNTLSSSSRASSKEHFQQTISFKNKQRIRLILEQGVNFSQSEWDQKMLKKGLPCAGIRPVKKKEKRKVKGWSF